MVICLYIMVHEYVCACGWCVCVCACVKLVWYMYFWVVMCSAMVGVSVDVV